MKALAVAIALATPLLGDPPPAVANPLADLVARLPETEKPIFLFNGRNLNGWDGDPKFWRVEDGLIIGENKDEVTSSTYLFTEDKHRNFRLLLEVKQTVSPEHSTMHSAVAALGERFEDKGDNRHGFKGPLLMFCHDWGIWDAYGRNRVFPPGQKGPIAGLAAEKKGEWNRVEFLVTGNRIRCVANGQLVMDFTDQPGMLRASPLGLQLHSNKRPQKFSFRGLVLTADPADQLLTLNQASKKG